MENGNLDRQGVTSVPITEDNQFMKYDLWITTLIFLSLTLATQIISAGLCIFNTATVPIETLVGPMGIYLTNTIGGKYRRESTRNALLVYLEPDLCFNEFLFNQCLETGFRIDWVDNFVVMGRFVFEQLAE